MTKVFSMSALLVIWMSLSCNLLCGQDQAASQQEAEVKEVFSLFKKGVEQGDLALIEKITTRDFFPFFEPFSRSLADVYSRYKAALPMEIGVLKILKTGQAKVEVYLNPARNLFVFTLKKEGDAWKICHYEGIRFPVYSVPPLPCRDIYEIPKDQLKYMIAETELNLMTRVYFTLKQSLGEEKAAGFFMDGPGYRVAMDAWLPFLEGAAQFAFFFAIMESNFYGSRCEVVQASYEEAEVHCSRLAALEVLERGYAVPKFTYEEYTELWTSIMKNRAQACGLDVSITFKDTSCVMKIRKISPSKTKMKAQMVS